LQQQFAGFDRSPYLASFQLTGLPLSVQLVNVQLFFGSDATRGRERRALETAAVAKWTDLRHKSRYLGAHCSGRLQHAEAQARRRQHRHRL